MKIPYGICDFGAIRSEGFFYADKTPFLPVLESGELGHRYLIFLRPRRFGKSTLVSMLEHYYDIERKDQFDQLFKGLWVHEHPTPVQGAYLVLKFDFSTVATDGGPKLVRKTFFDAVKGGIETFLVRYRTRVPLLARVEARVPEIQDAGSLLGALLAVISATPHKIYALVDEYDHFANRLLAAGSEDLYESIVSGAGFVRTFFATLKAGTSSAVQRILITGVSPLMLDDLSSGFNIASNVSTSRFFNSLAGFTRAEVERAVDDFLAVSPRLAGDPQLGDRDRLMSVLEAHYNGYRFWDGAEERVFNSDMVLYFLRQVGAKGAYPEKMLDPNVRTEYRHLQRIGTITGAKAAERRALLETVMEEGSIESRLVDQFGASSLWGDAQFISLLYYIGMLTFGPSTPDRLMHRLEIPNQVIRKLQWEHLASMLKAQDHVTIDARQLDAALRAMGTQGDIQPFLDLFHAQVVEKIGLKDTRRLSEKTLKLMLMTHLSLSQMFHVLSEKELAQGYCDLFLGASPLVPGARFSWLLEFKYLKSGARPAQVEAAFAEAQAQVERYASDRALLPLLLGNRQLKAGMIVFVGVKKALFRAWPAEAAPGGKAAASGKKAVRGKAASGKKAVRGKAASAKKGSRRRASAARKRA
jgi:hypothetical protein